MTDSDRLPLTPLDLSAQPGRPAWALLVFGAVQVVIAVVYFATGLWFRAPNPYIYLIYFAGFLAAIITLIWAIVTLHTFKRKGIPRFVTVLSAISVGLYALSLLFVAYISANLHP